jgi:hypothetical protein
MRHNAKDVPLVSMESSNRSAMRRVAFGLASALHAAAAFCQDASPPMLENHRQSALTTESGVGVHLPAPVPQT